MRKLMALILVCSLLGCASPHYIDLGNCGVRAACVEGAVKYSYPNVETRLVYSEIKGVPHMEVEVFLDGEWHQAFLVDIDFKPDIIDFRR